MVVVLCGHVIPTKEANCKQIWLCQHLWTEVPSCKWQQCMLFKGIVSLRSRIQKHVCVQSLVKKKHLNFIFSWWYVDDVAKMPNRIDFFENPDLSGLPFSATQSAQVEQRYVYSEFFGPVLTTVLPWPVGQSAAGRRVRGGERCA